jgi:DNA-binding LytR/AlgR family response regulator
VIRCLIVDDEELARRHLSRLLAAHSDFQIVDEAANGVEALEIISDDRPSVVFLDIEMPGLNAFEMVAQLKQPPLIVFATAYEQYAIAAFEANAVDYLLKPIQPVRLAKALDKIRAALQSPRPDYTLALQRVSSAVRQRVPARLAARRGKRIILLSPKDVVYIMIEGEIVFFHTHADRFSTDHTIAELEELLGPAGFFRISRSAIINLNHARELLPWSSGTWKVKLSNNVELDVSRDRARQLKSEIG